MEVKPTRPIMHMIAGPNGAGKSTLYDTVLSQRLQAPFINADIIQKQELNDPSMEAAYTAAVIAETRRQEYIQKKRSFVSESTFSHASKLKLIENAKKGGFRVILYHVNVRTPDLSVHRVAARVHEGGHDVPEDKIRARYARNQRLIRSAIISADNGIVYDNSQLNEPPRWIILFEAGKIINISTPIPQWARHLYARKIKRFINANPAIQ